ncbi:major facilitator superfamily multidrug-resistance, DHA1 sub-family [Coprinopsis marcescibilis]|uniref:Major facilitator superfamily multidrug-resistance, DHA1 sub-family n=1 Tax=Coprinopsis marcescibilis TaxID=230819 RepID=A0A5C3LCW0_COPMA|nr:major facilitator superfamily multidrug-resistance, DHA1 sub-family [Coprinopsis marcescibilis]
MHPSSTEHQPLIGNSRQDGVAGGRTFVVHTDSERQGSVSRFPKGQFAILCFLRLLDPLSFTQIFPYVNELVRDLNVAKDPTQIGYYSGLVESAFAITQLFAIYPWAYFSDNFGRRPVILLGIVGLAISTLFFGLQTSFVGVIAMRALAGLFSGNVAVIPSMLCEITDATNQAVVFPLFGIWWPIGAIVGPLIGGMFSQPATKFPSYFKHPFFKEYPYFLPGFMASAFAFTGFLLAFFYLKETLDRNQESNSTNKVYGTTQRRSGAIEEKRVSLRNLLSDRIIRALCTSGCAMSFLSTAFEVLFVLFCYTPVSQGGLGFPITSIGYALATSGVFAAILQAFFMPILLNRFQHASIYHFSIKLWAPVFLCMPLLHLLVPSHASQSSLPLWIAIALVLVIARVAFLSFSVNMLLVKRFAPNQASIGSTTGLVQFSICLARAVSPAFVSTVYALSKEHSVLGGHCWVVVMVGLAVACCTFSRAVVQETRRLRR